MITLIKGNESRRLSDFNLRALADHENATSATFSHNRESVPGYPGYFDFGCEITDRTHVITARNLFIDESDFQDEINALNSFCYDEYGKPAQLRLVYDYESDKYFNVQIDQPSVPARGTIAKQLSLQFTSYDPYKYARALQSDLTFDATEILFSSEVYTYDEQSDSNRIQMRSETTVTFDSTVVTYDSTSYTYENNKENSSTISERLSLSNRGLTQPLLIKITGSASSLSITMNNVMIQSLGAFSNSTILLDYSNFVKMVNGQENFLENQVEIKQGQNSVSVTGTNTNCDVEFIYRERWN